MPSPQSIELFTRKPAETERRDFPLTVGIPFAKGAVRADTPVAVCDRAGKALPLQTSVMENHDDGSVRWMLLDFQADLPPLDLARHTVTLGRKSPEPPPGRRIEVEEDGGSLIVNNGVLKIELLRRRCTALRRV